MVTWILVLSVVGALISSEVRAGTVCGSEEAKNLVEDEVLESARSIDPTHLAVLASSIQVRRTSGQISSPHHEFEAAAAALMRSSYDVSLSETFQSGEESSVASCKGTLRATAEDGTFAGEPIEYKIVLTDDGKTLLRGEDPSLTTLFLFANLLAEQVTNRALSKR